MPVRFIPLRFKERTLPWRTLQVTPSQMHGKEETDQFPKKLYGSEEMKDLNARSANLSLVKSFLLLQTKELIKQWSKKTKAMEGFLMLNV